MVIGLAAGPEAQLLKTPGLQLHYRPTCLTLCAFGVVEQDELVRIHGLQLLDSRVWGPRTAPRAWLGGPTVPFSQASWYPATGRSCRPSSRLSARASRKLEDPEDASAVSPSAGVCTCVTGAIRRRQRRKSSNCACTILGQRGSRSQNTLHPEFCSMKSHAD